MSSRIPATYRTGNWPAFNKAFRRTTGFVESLLTLIGSDRAVPDFSTLSRRQKTLAMNLPCRGSNGP